MALARIITRSHLCSRELALDLLARGYTVEIVSPDQIPDNIADLELRVDVGPGDQLIASVESHSVDRSASLEFLHHLKSPMGDFVRRPAELVQADPPRNPVSLHEKPRLEYFEPPLEERPAFRPAHSHAQNLPVPISEDHLFGHDESNLVEIETRFNFENDLEESARLISQPGPLQQGDDLSSFSGLASPIAQPVDVSPILTETAAAPEIIPSTASETRSASPEGVQVPEEVYSDLAGQESVGNSRTQAEMRRRASRLFRAGLAVAGVLMLALVLWSGLRRSGKDYVQASANLPVDETAVNSTGAASFVTAGPEKISSNPAPPVTPDARLAATPPKTQLSDANSERVPSPAQGTSVQSPHPQPRSATRSKVSRANGGDGLIARDTVVYLDKNFAAKDSKTKAPKKSARRHTNSVKRRNSGVAPNTVTYLNGTPATQTPK
jgi:hypothetical protein